MSNRTIYSSFKEIADRYPDNPAIVEDNRTISYAELDAMVNAILARFYNQKQAFIGIVMRHGAEQIAAILAVLKSGAAYVPAEPFLPQDRIDYMMKTAGVKLVITDDYCHDLTPANVTFDDRSTPDSIAYILYTSGTTGKPKGVIQENHSVVNYCEAFEAEMHTGPGDVMLQYSVCSFDIFVEEVFTTLLNGATLAIPTIEVHNGPLSGLMDFCKRHNVTIIDGFPYLIADLNKRPELLPHSVNLIISGGDVIRESYITNLRDKGIRIYNTYGPSETCVCSNYFRVDNAKPLEDGTFSIGKAIKGVEVKILDKNLNEVPAGEIGEICIFGEGVNQGYLGNPPEQANFVTLTDGTCLYRSGDMGYLLPDGNMAFLHRRDEQVMILGKRVEPEEVENVLNDYSEVERGIVRAFLDDGGLHYLVAYIVPRKGFSLHDVREYLKSKLADFMVPEFFVAVNELPLTHRGKIDMKLLPKVLKEGNYK
ncbi:MAG: amino acid adenylation domain-containing protein [Muribaculaceae bacterium]|nr:amino acid adenylation domain-containing protein [Muribaculaceae bacterium]